VRSDSFDELQNSSGEGIDLLSRHRAGIQEVNAVLLDGGESKELEEIM
jgi:hypothetical protein